MTLKIDFEDVIHDAREHLEIKFLILLFLEMLGYQRHLVMVYLLYFMTISAQGQLHILN